MFTLAFGFAAMGAALLVPVAAVVLGSFEARLAASYRKMSKAVVDAAKVWAAKRDLPLDDVLATILLESRGNPKAHNKSAREDSRGLMQVNVNAHPQYASANLYDIDKGLEAGTAILASQRKAVRGWLDACKAPVAFDIGTYTRLAYANPSLTKAMLAKARSRSETVHPFRDAETYVEHWRAALRVVRAQGAVS